MKEWWNKSQSWFFSGEKNVWQKVWETTFTLDQNEREPAWQLMRWTFAVNALEKVWFGIFDDFGAGVA